MLVVSEVLKQNQKKKAKSAPKFRICKHPMKGHKYVKDCPKNTNKEANN